MVEKSPENIDLENPPNSRILTTHDVRESVRFQIIELGKNVFQTLQKTGTESLIAYLCTISIEPIVKAWSTDQKGIQDLLKAIWPTQHALVGQFLANGKFKLNQLTDCVQTLLDTDEFGPTVFETLAIFTEIIPLMEEQFRLKEWVLLQLRMELQIWHRQGKFQRLSITIASEQYSPSSMSRGDLQIQVSASKPTIVAGQEFSVFVVIGNPFEVPIVLYSVETQIPVELVDVAEKQVRLNLLSEDPIFRRRQAGLWNSFLRLTWDRWRMNLRIAAEPENRIAQAVAAPEIGGAKQKPIITITQSVGSMASDSRVIGAQIERYQSIDIEIDSVSPKHLDNLLWRLEGFKKGMIPIVLQPGDSVVKQFIFRTKSWLFFTPLAHALQIQVRYGVDDRDHLDTVPYQLTIQAAITATMVGAVLGGAIGGVARLINALQSDNAETGTQILSLLLAVILSAITVVSFARKSGVQQIVSIEDFWGGLFLGFLIGFLGQSFALDLITPRSG